MIELKNTKLFKCECGNHTFDPQFIIRKRSAIQSKTGKEEFITVQILACSACKKVLPEYDKMLVDEYI